MGTVVDFKISSSGIGLIRSSHSVSCFNCLNSRLFVFSSSSFNNIKGGLGFVICVSFGRFKFSNNSIFKRNVSLVGVDVSWNIKINFEFIDQIFNFLKLSSFFVERVIFIICVVNRIVRVDNDPRFFISVSRSSL